MSKFVIKKNKSGYVFFIEGEDAIIIGSSETYDKMAGAKIGIESLKALADICSVEDQTKEKYKKLRNPKFEIYRDGNKKLRFRMKAKNGRILLSSPAYHEEDEILGAIEVVKKTAADAPIETQ